MKLPFAGEHTRYSRRAWNGEKGSVVLSARQAQPAPLAFQGALHNRSERSSLTLPARMKKTSHDLLDLSRWPAGQGLHPTSHHASNLPQRGDGFVHHLAWHADGFVMAVTSGQPGTGKFLSQQPDDAAPFFIVPKPNCHSLAVHPNGKRIIVAATNGNSAGNGRPLKGNGYLGNFSPLLVWDMPKG